MCMATGPRGRECRKGKMRLRKAGTRASTIAPSQSALYAATQSPNPDNRYHQNSKVIWEAFSLGAGEANRQGARIVLEAAPSLGLPLC